MKNFKYIALSFILILLMTAPALSFAEEEGLVPCGKPAPAWTVTSTGERGEQLIEECTFDHLLELVDHVIKFILFYLAVPIAAVMFAYAGISLIVAQGAEGKTQAKNIFVNVATGLILVAGAWLIIKTILEILGYNGAWIGF